MSPPAQAPVSNQQVFKDRKDFIVMVGGPNAGKDYRVDAGEGLFFFSREAR